MKLSVHEIVMKIIGPVTPIGDSNEDRRRLASMKELTILVDMLIFDIQEVARRDNAPEASIKEVGTHAMNFLRGLLKGE